jgi:predicted metal-dependent peptidase
MSVIPSVTPLSKSIRDLIAAQESKNIPVGLTPKQRVERIVVTIVTHIKFMRMGGYLCNVNVIEDDNPIAFADGLNISISTGFVKLLDQKELAFVLLHEAWHCAFKHFFIWKELDEICRTTTNIAMDYVINLQLRDYDPDEVICKFPTGIVQGVIDERFRGMNTREVFDIIYEEREQGQEHGEGWDVHGWDSVEQLNADETVEVLKQVDQRNRQGDVLVAAQSGKGMGSGSLGNEQIFNELFEPKLDPYALLQDYMTALCPDRNDSSFRKPNRRFLSEEIIMPSYVGEALPSLGIAIDLSGSMGWTETTEALTETSKIAESLNINRVDIMYWDCDVYHEVYEGEHVKDFIHTTKPLGGGGTDIEEVPRFIKAKGLQPNVLIVITDGEVGTINKWCSIPTIFIVVSNGTIESSMNNFGSVIKLNKPKRRR